ncbi:MAG: hypothetical protein JO329_09265, partial [Planctomycetaceae bacterium]|nr:hypothetical protein [Planctomycetaceae bacterium]
MAGCRDRADPAPAREGDLSAKPRSERPAIPESSASTGAVQEGRGTRDEGRGQAIPESSASTGAVLILYTTLLEAFYRARFGVPPDLSADGDGDGRGLVLVADGCGGLELCGMSLRYVMGAMRAPHAVRLVP